MALYLRRSLRAG